MRIRIRLLFFFKKSIKLAVSFETAREDCVALVVGLRLRGNNTDKQNHTR